MKFKMAATTGFSLTLDPMGKMFQIASSLKPLGQLKTVGSAKKFVRITSGFGGGEFTRKLTVCRFI